MRTTLIFTSLMCVCCCLALAGGAEETAATWQVLPRLPRARGEAVITGMGVDSGGTLWVMTNTAPHVWSEPVRKLFWWDGAKWHEPKNADEVKGDFFYCLFGGGARGFYGVYWNEGRGAKKGDPATICKLVEGEVQPVTEYAHASWLDPRTVYAGAFPSAGLYVAGDGRLFAYGKGFLDVYHDGEWKRLAEPKQPRSVTFLEREDVVYVVYDDIALTVAPHSSIVPRQFQLEGLSDNEMGCAEHAVLWGDDRLLVVTWPRPEPVNIQAYELATGELVDIEDVKQALKGKVIDDAVRAPDGSAWILPADAIFIGQRLVVLDNAGALRVLTREGDLFELEELSTVSWMMKRSRSYPTSTLTASDGTFWLAPNNGGLVAVLAGVVEFHALPESPDNADDEPPATPHAGVNFLAEAPDGTIYAASADAVCRRPPEANRKALDGRLGGR